MQFIYNVGLVAIVAFAVGCEKHPQKDSPKAAPAPSTDNAPPLSVTSHSSAPFVVVLALRKTRGIPKRDADVIAVGAS